MKKGELVNRLQLLKDGEVEWFFCRNEHLQKVLDRFQATKFVDYIYFRAGPPGLWLFLVIS